MKASLEGKLYEIQKLKQQYGINSSNALGYMKSEAVYERLRTEVNKSLEKEHIRLGLSLKELSNLCKNTHFVIGDALDAVYFKRTGDPEHFFIKEYNPFLRDAKVPWAEYIPGKPGLHTRHDAFREDTFTFDYAAFLQEFARSCNTNKNRQEAFRQAFLVFLDSKHKYLTSQTGEKISYAEFMEKVTMKKRGLSIEEMTSSPELIEDVKGLTKFSREYLENLEEWRITGSSNYDKAKVEFEEVTEEERKFLYSFYEGESTYERAAREMTLGYQDIQRQIALQYIMGTYQINKESPEIVKEAIVDLSQALHRRRERYQKMLKVDIPEVITKKGKTHAEKTQYTLVAVKENKKWLEDILSR